MISQFLPYTTRTAFLARPPSLSLSVNFSPVQFQSSIVSSFQRIPLLCLLYAACKRGRSMLAVRTASIGVFRAGQRVVDNARGCECKTKNGVQCLLFCCPETTGLDAKPRSLSWSSRMITCGPQVPLLFYLPSISIHLTQQYHPHSIQRRQGTNHV